MQLRLMSQVRTIGEVHAWSPHPESLTSYVEEMSDTLRVPVIARETPASAVSAADLVVTATPSREPFLDVGMLRRGSTVVALGSDGPEKRELTSELVALADKVVTDLTSQCSRLGELHHAVDDGLMSSDDVHAELGQILVGERTGREGSEDIVCDLTGVGVQDAAIAEVAFSALMAGRAT
jgi:ornithine cyclodeaminase